MNISFDSRVSGELSPLASTKILNAGVTEAPEPHVHLDPDPGFSMQVSLQNQVIGVRVAGDLDRYTAFLFTMALKRLERLEIPTITVDLSELEFIDNSGLAALREARQRADLAARTFNAKLPSPRVRRFLVLAGEGGLLAPSPAAGSLPRGFGRLGQSCSSDPSAEDRRLGAENPLDSLPPALNNALDLARGGLWSEFREGAGLSVQIEGQKDSAWLALSGELDHASLPLIEESLALAQGGRDSVVIDLDGLAFMDSSGIEAFQKADHRARAAKGRFCVVNVHKHHRLFELCAALSLLGEDPLDAKA